jgi:hypothetical protein
VAGGVRAVSLDYGYGDDGEREHAEREDIAQEQALRILLGLDEPLTESTNEPGPGRGTDDQGRAAA